MSYASKAFVIMIILCIAGALYSVNNIYDKMDSIEQTRNSITEIHNISAEYLEKEDLIEGYRQVVEFTNRPAPDMQKLMHALADPSIKGLKFNALDARARKDNSFFVTINGISFVDTYSSMQALLANLTDKLGKTEGVHITDKVLDMENRTFRVELEYR
jgi:hypothetical protein